MSGPHAPRPPRRGARIGAVGLALLALSLAGPAGAEDAPPPPDVSLDRLLKLPDDYGTAGQGQKGGASAPEWRRRFREAHADLDRARHKLERAQSELEQLAGGTEQWQMAAPGASNPENSPVSFKLREEIRRQRSEVTRAERELRDLEVEANLAGVPEEWRQAAE